MDPISDGPWQYSEDSGEVAHDVYSAEDGWIPGDQLREVVGLELLIKHVDPECPRCRAFTFNYGPMRFCSSGCPENLLLTDELG